MIQEVDLQRAKELIEEGVPIVDVREQRDYDSAHVPGAVHIPLNDILMDTSILPEGDILFVCNVGVTSRVASEMALATGHVNVYNLSDGTKGWVAEGNPVDTA